SSLTKHFPIFWRKLSDKQLRVLLSGYSDADGFYDKKNSSITLKTISKKLALECKELLFKIKCPSNFYLEISPQRNGKITHSAYTLRFKVDDDKNILNKRKYKNEQGYF